MNANWYEFAGEVFGRITTLAYLSGRLTEEKLFEELLSVNRQEVWLGATQVLVKKIMSVKRQCEQGLIRTLKAGIPLTKEIQQKIAEVFRRLEPHGEMPQLLVDAWMEFFGNSEELCNQRDFFDWIAVFSEEDALLALNLCERIVVHLEATCAHRLWHMEGLTKAALCILREADSIDDPAFIKRAIALQDKLLELGLPRTEEALDALVSTSSNTNTSG